MLLDFDNQASEEGVPVVATNLPVPSRGPADESAVEPLRVSIRAGRRYDLSVYSLGLACCAVEFVAAAWAEHDLAGLEVAPLGAGPEQVDVLVISGTVTDKMAPAVRRFYEQMDEPRYVLSFGACSCSGGPYWDSYSVTKGVDQLIPVDVYVPGCPPRPEALLDGLRQLHARIDGGQVTV